MSDAASPPASGLRVQDAVALRAGGAWAPVLQLTLGGLVPREDWSLGGGCHAVGQEAAVQEGCPVSVFLPAAPHSEPLHLHQCCLPGRCLWGE